jgi:hypothetical protein
MSEKQQQPQLDTKHVMTLKVFVDRVYSAGNVGCGERRVIPITGGNVMGLNGVEGSILPLGADFQIIHNQGHTELEAKYMLQMSDGATIYIENKGIRTAGADVMAKLNAGESVDPSLVYFRTVPRFETSDPRYKWLQRHVFVATCERHPETVIVHVFQVL